MNEYDNDPRHAGVVKWFDDTRGYGFIESEAGEELFAHYSAIRGEGYRSLKKGQWVAFEIRRTVRGPQAADITPLP